MTKKLTPQQTLFCEHYASGKDGATAAKLAGYTGKTIKDTAYKLLLLPKIKEEVQRLQNKITNKLDVKREEILLGLLEMFKKENNHDAKDRINAAKEINKMCGFYAPEKSEHQHSGSVVLYIPHHGRGGNE
jgi:phage terminase small subunit